ncbi:MAG TPA: RiPP maturation radical SAM C-methyltransferase [Pyrinomonadaceae bacterium]|jgi:magnesium-protoporphyrin IX monomethyl ester (oxidative) cyclase|nr:RiPP maturation radical SAM C-methyltransferase [Pyrinomonadaceae bacterium]
MDIVLVSMPFAEIQRPSIALSLLQASLADTGIRSEVVYGNFGLAETIGLAAYQAMQSVPTDHLLGEWCFANSIFPDAEAKDEEYLNLTLEVRCSGVFPASLEERKELMRRVRAKCAGYVEQLAEAIVARGPRIVGCSSVFQQHCASLALLKRVRELSPETVLLMGGANCEGEMGMETLRAFPWVDCVVSGEADALFPELCSVLLEQGRAVKPVALPGGAISQAHLKKAFPILSTDNAQVPRALIRDMDALPTPNYDDYFETLKASTLSNMIEPELLAESSRGCWWGEKSHCTFCGLNGNGMKYRSKSPDRIIAELSQLSQRYGIRNIQFVDNILDMSFFKTVLPTLASADDKYSIFYETKSNLKREQVKLLAEAGIRWIQPGVESLDDKVLALIGKGNSALMNLQLLKWSSEFDIHASWNMLCGIPGESDSWYSEMAGWLPAIFHLQPPAGVIRVRYDRFSPYHMRPQDFGLTLEPSRAYSYVYPLPKESLMRLAYSFEDSGNPGHIHRGLHDQPGQWELQEVIRQWNDMWRTARPVLRVYDDGEQLKFFDTRPCANQRSWTAEGLEAEVYRLCDSAQTPTALIKQCSTSLETPVSTPEVEEAIESLRRAKVLLSLNGKLLSVGVNAA